MHADEVNKRSWPGGVGFCKCGGNYAPTVYVAEEWAKKGYSQVLWLGHKKDITEGGAMNIFFYWINEQGIASVSPFDPSRREGARHCSFERYHSSWYHQKVHH